MTVYKYRLTDILHCKPLFTVVDSTKSLHASGLFHTEFLIGMKNEVISQECGLSSPQFMHFCSF